MGGVQRIVPMSEVIWQGGRTCSSEHGAREVETCETWQKMFFGVFVLMLAWAAPYAPHAAQSRARPWPWLRRGGSPSMLLETDEFPRPHRHIASALAPGASSLRERRLRRMYTPPEHRPEEPPCLTRPVNGTIDMWLFEAADGTQWGAVGVNRSQAATWLRYERLEVAPQSSDDPSTSGGGTHVRVVKRLLRQRDRTAALDVERWAAGAAAAAPAMREAALAHALRCERLELTERATHRRLERLWRQQRLLLRGVRFSELATHGRLHTAARREAEEGETDEVAPEGGEEGGEEGVFDGEKGVQDGNTRSSNAVAGADDDPRLVRTSATRRRRLVEREFRQRLVEREFRHELLSHVRRVRRLQSTCNRERHALLYYFRSHSGVELGALQRSALERHGVDASLEGWRRLLRWFKGHFPYNRATCAECGAGPGELLGNVYPSARELSFAASRAELQHCRACGAVTRFPRYNDVQKVLRTRTGRCGEYSQVLLQLAHALGWRARLVVDWTDHMWIELKVPEETPGAEGAEDNEAAVAVAARGGAAAATAGEASGRPLVPLMMSLRRRVGKRAVRRRRQGDCAHRWVAMDPCEATVDEPLIYGRDWGKTLTYVVAIGDGTLVDVTSSYSHDWNATLTARTLAPEQVARSLRWVSRLPWRPPWA